MVPFDIDEWVETCMKSNNTIELKRLRHQFNDSVEPLALQLSGSELNCYINQGFDCLVRQAIRLAEDEMVRFGYGSSPVVFDFVLFGSGGRREQTLWSDFDNGLIYDYDDACADIESPSSRVHKYFEELSRHITKYIEAMGFPPCEGNVTCRSAHWRKSACDFITLYENWTTEANWESIRYLLICADIRCVYGPGELTQSLRDTLKRLIEADPDLIGRMLRNTLKHKMLLGVFGQFLKEEYGKDAGSVDMKYGAYLPMVNAIRLLALFAGLDTTHTLNRLEALRLKDIINEKQYHDWRNTFELFLQLRNSTDSKVDDGFFISDGMLRLENLSQDRKHQLKDALRNGRELQRFIKKKFARWRE